MTKNLHVKILLVLLLCFVVALVAFACTPQTSTIVSTPGGGSGGGSGGSGGSSGINVTGGTRSESSVTELFSYLKEALAVEDESDTLAFKFTSKDISVVKSGETSTYYADLECKYNRRNDSKTELLFEIHSSLTRELVLGAYYVNSVLYLNIPHEDGAVTIYMDEISLRDVVTVAENLAEVLPDKWSALSESTIPVLNWKIGDEINTIFNDPKNPFIKASKIEKDDATKITLQMNFNVVFNKIVTVVKLAQTAFTMEEPIDLTQYDFEGMFAALFGTTVDAFTSMTMEPTTCEVNVNIKGGELVSIDSDFVKGVDTFELGFVIDNEYYGFDDTQLGIIEFPEFTDYDNFGITNMEFTFRLDLENASEKQVIQHHSFSLFVRF